MSNAGTIAVKKSSYNGHHLIVPADLELSPAVQLLERTT
jgi:hypothetical protein